MADRNLALSLLITAKDAASAVLGRVRSAVTGVTGQNQQYAAGADSSAAANDRFAGSLGGVISRLGGLAAAYLSINGLKSAFESVINVGAKFETLSIQVNNLMGSIEAGEQATAWIKDFAKNTPLELDGVTKAFVKLKAFGLDPMDGTLQSLTDLTSKLGGGQAELEGIVLAVGQAWSKQKLQTEEINQLVERGVPVWDLLAKVTGRTTAELQKLAEQGALGRDVIKALITEIGQSSAGSSAAMMATWTGLISNLQDSWTNFLASLADAGLLDYVKAQVTSLQSVVNTLGENSKQVYEGIKAIGSIAADAVGIKLVQMLLQSAAAMTQNAQATLKAAFAAKQKAAADKLAQLAAIDALRTEAALAAVRVKAALETVNQLRLQKALTTGKKEEALATKELTLAIQQLHAAQAKQVAANDALAASLEKTAAKAGIAAKSFGALNGAFSLLLAYDIGKSIGEWANQFEIVRKAGTYLAQTFVLLKTIGSDAFDGVGFDKIKKDISSVNAEFDQMRKDAANSKPIEIKTKIDAKPAQEGLAQVEIGANAAIEKFKEWDKQSTATVDNIASELRKLSEVELANLKSALQKSFDAGTQSSEDLQKALAAIKTEELSRAWKTLGQQSSASLKTAADAAKAAYVTIRDSGTASAADLDQAWASVTKQILAAKDATNVADAAEKQRRANIAELDQIGATPEEKLNAKRKLLTDQTIAYDKAQREGDYAEAARIAQEKEQLAFQNARAEIEAAQSGEIASYRAYDAKKAYLRAIEDTKKALSGLSQQEKTALDNAGVETQQQSLEKLQATLSKFNQPIEIKLTDNFDQILARADQVAARIAELNAGANNVGAGNDGAGDTTEQALSREVLKRGRRTQ